jgi:hypothetical protein
MGRLEKDGTSDVVDLMPKVNSNSTVMMNLLMRGVQLQENLGNSKTDYNAMTFRRKVDNIIEDSYLEKLEK